MRICEELENRIRALGGEPAFPVNVGINEIAAHYTSPPGDLRKIPYSCLVKVDFGAHVDGYLADTAVTVNVSSERYHLVKAAEEALALAVRMVKPGMRVSQVGEAVEAKIRSFGLKPIRNLTGHKIDRFQIHAGKSVPNVGGINGTVFKSGEIYAVEPFVTTAEAEGSVENSKESFIYRMVRERKLPETARLLLKKIQARYRGLPFAARWLVEDTTAQVVSDTLGELLREKCIMSYPVLVEASRNPVAQAEHTVFVTEDACEVLT